MTRIHEIQSFDKAIRRIRDAKPQRTMPSKHTSAHAVKAAAQLNDAHDIAIVHNHTETNRVTPRLALLVAILAACYAWLSTNSTYAPASTQTRPSIDDADTSVESFLQWFEQAGGVKAPTISIAIFEGMGRGIIAQNDVNELDRLLFVPMDLILCRETILKQYAGDATVFTKLQKLASSSEELLTAFLLLEHFKNTSSTWYPYLRLVPPLESAKRASSPLFYESQMDVDELQDPRMIAATMKERQHAKLAFQRFRRLFKTVIADASTRALPLEKSYLWARFLVNSRAFSIQGERYLVPLGDVFNGQSQPVVSQRRVHANGAHFLQYHRLLPGKGMEVLADRSTASGEQLFEDYGDNDNYIYALYHGFLMPGNAFDCAAVTLPVTTPSRRSSIAATKRQIIRNAGLDDDALVVCVTPNGRLATPHDDRVATLYTSLMLEDDARMLALCSQREYEGLCFNHATQHQVDATLVDAVSTQLQSYPTTLEEDDALLISSDHLPPAMHFAVRFRVSRKSILRAAEVTLHQRIESCAARQKQVHDTEPVIDEGDTSTEARIARFQQWIHQLDLPVNHVELKYVSPSMGYGAFTTKPVAKGEVYLAVPSDLVMDIHSAMRSPFIRQLLASTKAASSIRWTETQLLLLHLLYEKFESPSSFWKPYLDTLPTHDRLASPLFYVTDSVELSLLDAAVPEDLALLIHEYRRRVGAEYALLVRTQVLPEWVTLERFRWANAILDSRSIWWGRTRHLVPLLDMVNCEELADTHEPHATVLDDDASATTRASWAFTEGEHVVENYAQPNYIYLLYHGFVLARNSHDCAHFHFELSEAKHLPSQDKDRRTVVRLLENMQFYSWSVDVCAREKDLPTLLRVALIDASPTDAARAETQLPGQITQAHVDAATTATTRRLTRLQGALGTKDPSRDAGTVLLYVKQQAGHMQELLDALNAFTS